MKLKIKYLLKLIFVDTYVIWVIALTFFIHKRILYLQLPTQIESIDKYIEMSVQIAGVALLLLSLNSNMKIFNKHILSPISKWFKDFSNCFKKTVYLKGIACSHSTATGTLTALSRNTNKSIEEKVEELIKDNKEIKKEIKTIRSEIEVIDAELNTKVLSIESGLKSSINEVKSIVEEITIGDIRPQILGMFFVLYGTFLT